MAVIAGAAGRQGGNAHDLGAQPVRHAASKVCDELGFLGWEFGGRIEPGPDQPVEIKDGVARAFLSREMRARAVINRERHVLWANGPAISQLKSPLPVIIAAGLLDIADADDPKAFFDFLSATDEHPQRYAVSSQRGAYWVVLNAWSGFHEGCDAIYLDFNLSLPPLGASSSGMARQFGLTPAECDVIDALVRLDSPVAAAERLQISINTVRTHVRRLFAKTAVHSQAQLIRLASAFCAG